MTDRWETRKAESERRVRLAVAAYVQTLLAPVRLKDQTWDIGPMGTVEQPLDPSVFGLGVLYATVVDDEPLRYIVVRFRDGSSEYFTVEGLEIETNPRSSYYEHWHDFYATTVSIPLPKDLSSFQKEGGAEVSMTGGGTRDPHKVGIAARVLGIAAFLAEHLDGQMKTPYVEPEEAPDMAVCSIDGEEYDREDDLNHDHDPEHPNHYAYVPVITPERFVTLGANKWVAAEMQPKNGRKRTVRGDLVEINSLPVFTFQRDDPQAIVLREQLTRRGVKDVTIKDKAGRYQIVDIEHVRELIVGGPSPITLARDGALAPDYRLHQR